MVQNKETKLKQKSVIAYLGFVVPCIFKHSIKHPTRCTINLIFIALSRRHRSTCFEHYCAHHQEPPSNCLCSLWLPYDCRVGCVSNCGPFETRPTRQSYGNQRLQRQLEGAPDDGRNNARNMLSGVYAIKQ
jgi:hypothetical protein